MAGAYMSLSNILPMQLIVKLLVIGIHRDAPRQNHAEGEQEEHAAQLAVINRGAQDCFKDDSDDEKPNQDKDECFGSL